MIEVFTREELDIDDRCRGTSGGREGAHHICSEQKICRQKTHYHRDH